MLDKGNEEDWFNSNFIIATAIVSAIALATFLIWELTDKEPIVNLKLFRHRNFSAGTLTLMLSYGGFFSIGLLVPQWLQTQLHYTAVWSGLASAPIGLLPVLLTPFVGKYAAKFDMRMLASTAFLVMGLSSFYRSGFTADIDFARVAWVQLFQGLGIAFFFMPVLTILLSDLEGHEIAAGSGLATFLRTLGGTTATTRVANALVVRPAGCEVGRRGSPNSNNAWPTSTKNVAKASWRPLAGATGSPSTNSCW